MARISTKINLRQLKHIVKKMKRKNGTEVDCLIIPIKENNLYQSEKSVFLDLIGFDFENSIEGSKDTHLVKQSLPKELLESMSDDQKKALPILGNHIVWARQEPVPQTADLDLGDEPDDLPF